MTEQTPWSVSRRALSSFLRMYHLSKREMIYLFIGVPSVLLLEYLTRNFGASLPHARFILDLLKIPSLWLIGLVGIEIFIRQVLLVLDLLVGSR